MGFKTYHVEENSVIELDLPDWNTWISKTLDLEKNLTKIGKTKQKKSQIKNKIYTKKNIWFPTSLGLSPSHEQKIKYKKKLLKNRLVNVRILLLLTLDIYF